MGAQVFLLYVATWTLVALTPGPAVMCSMAQATRHGFRASLIGISGIQTGNLLFFLAVALGLGALLEKATAIFTMLRTVGALYLFYLGVRIIVSTFRRRRYETETVVEAPSQESLFIQGLLIQVTNPKALLFVSALLPQFINSSAPAAPQLAILVAATIVIDAIVLSSYAFLAQNSARSFRTSRIATWLERAFGAALVFFGLKLLVARK